RLLVVAARPVAAERARVLERAAVPAEHVGQPAALVWSVLWRIDAAFERGDLAVVDARLAELDARSAAAGLPFARWHLHRLRAARCALTGDFTAAGRHAEDARAVAVRMGEPEMVVLHHAFGALVAVLRGDPTGVPHDLDDAFAGAPPVPVVQAQRAALELLAGRRERARARYLQVMAVLDEMPVNGRWLGTVLQLVDLAEGLDDAPGAARLHAVLADAEDFCGAGPSGTVFCTGSNALLLGRLATTAGRPEQALAHLRRALEVNARIGARPYVALTHLATARALLRRGRADDGPRIAAEARLAAGTARALGMPGPLAAAEEVLRRVSTGSPPGGLTRREEEVAQLVAHGLANREIAARLVLSERTVESHVHHALLKLGLGSRTQLTAWVLARAGGR
ncbi:LuxR C-terminal-related transcriptional regulator, partial [Kineococcus glutinatus]|uniref:LuxR C-terminal-related transcriptional regulator n=1 Tax=Kineococcus glutinatus TaxID=1070872 RepID=UPI0031E60719